MTVLLKLNEISSDRPGWWPAGLGMEGQVKLAIKLFRALDFWETHDLTEFILTNLDTFRNSGWRKVIYRIMIQLGPDDDLQG